MFQGDRVAGMARVVGTVQSSGGFAEQCVMEEEGKNSVGR